MEIIMQDENEPTVGTFVGATMSAVRTLTNAMVFNGVIRPRAGRRILMDLGKRSGSAEMVRSMERSAAILIAQRPFVRKKRAAPR